MNPVTAAIRGRCPRCAQGKLFQGLLGIQPRCAACGLDLSEHDTGDGPAVFVILILGALVTFLALMVELRWAPPVWVHVLLWLPATLGGAIALLRPLKGFLIGERYRTRREEFGG